MWTEPIVQNFLALAFLLGLMKTRLDFFYSGTDGDETSGTWGQSSISIPINLTTTLFGNSFLMTP